MVDRRLRSLRLGAERREWLAAGLAMIARFVDGYGILYDTNLSFMKFQEGGSDMTIGRKWLYAAMALTGGFLGGVAAMEFAPGVAIAAHQTRMLRAEQFELVDNSGSKRAVLKVTARGMADLMMFDGSGRDRAEFRVAQDGGASVGFYDEHGSRRVLVGEATQGRNGIAIYGSNGDQLAGLTATSDNQVNLTLYDPNTGRARVGIGVAANGSPAVVLFDQKGNDRAELNINSKGKAGLALADENGKTIAGLPAESTTQAPQ